mmetsp:Transcript_5048/g.12399  ORF Transcript_5048/g.12399 Transcript_5048/m.12399 type:complete len:242 (+) Transcript_5048:107-832(+)
MIVCVAIGIADDESGADRCRLVKVCLGEPPSGLQHGRAEDLDLSSPFRNGMSSASIDLCPRLIRLLLLLPLPFENTDEREPVLPDKLRETKRLDPGISENDDFFLVPFVPAPIVEWLAPLPVVPVDISSATGTDVILLDGDDDSVGECGGFLPRRKTLKAPSHRFRGGVSQGDGGAIIGLSNSFSRGFVVSVALDFLEDKLPELTFREERDGDRPIKYRVCWIGRLAAVVVVAAADVDSYI